MIGEDPLVTGLLPAWNAESFIQPTLDSLSAQSYPNYRVIASVDHSTDCTADVIRRHADQDGRFTVIEQSERLGWIGNVNALLDLAEGEYVHFAFHDDVVLPEFVADCMRRLKENPAAVLAFTDMTTRYVDGLIETSVYTELDGVFCAKTRAAKILGAKGDWWAPNRGVFRLSAARAVGGMEKYRAGEFSADWHWLLALALEGEFERTPKILVDKRYTKQSLSRKWRRRTWKKIAAEEQAAKIIVASKLSAHAKARLLGSMFLRILMRGIGLVGKKIGLR